LKFKSTFHLCFSVLAIAIIPTPAGTAHAQGVTPQSSSGSGVLNQLSLATFGGKTVQSIQLSGTARWYAGGSEDSGSANLTASMDGSSQLQLQLAVSGARIETQTGTGLSSVCQWSGADGVPHSIDPGNCWRPAVWFFPAFSFQPALLASNFHVVDLGSGAVGSSSNVYRHLQGQLAFNSLPSSLSTDLTQQSTTDIGLDPTSLLPAVLSYSVRPDDGAPTSIAVEIRYSDYHVVDGVEIPYLIQRYINGSLELAITVSSVKIA
jgi:hypothetical protein